MLAMMILSGVIVGRSGRYRNIIVVGGVLIAVRRSRTSGSRPWPRPDSPGRHRANPDLTADAGGSLAGVHVKWIRCPTPDEWQRSGVP
jgi:hypothetical protein